jgi:cytochrome c-type biogenesis protein CcmH/NrfG
MKSELENGASKQRWKSPQVYAMAGISLVLGLLLGYLFRDSGSHDALADRATAHSASLQPRTAGVPNSAPHAMPTLEQMQQMANKQAEPLLAKLKSDPKNAGLLNQVGTIYRATHQFKQAVEYYRQALQIAPNNVAARTDMASCLFYEGNVDAALDQLQQSLQYEPKDANSLFNLGMIRWQGKKDAKGAVAAWEQLLRSNPTIAESKRAEVKKLVAQVKQQSGPN